ncbi:MAG TPA: hypothetical protein VF760_09355 [Xanthobacteraceae bacterium]
MRQRSPVEVVDANRLRQSARLEWPKSRLLELADPILFHAGVAEQRFELCRRDYAPRVQFERARQVWKQRPQLRIHIVSRRLLDRRIEQRAERRAGHFREAGHRREHWARAI